MPASFVTLMTFQALMAPEIRSYGWKLTTNIALMILVSVVEWNSTCTKEIMHQIKPNISAINRELCNKLKIRLSREYCIVFERNDEMFRSLTENVVSDADLYLLGYGSSGTVTPVYLSGIPSLSGELKYLVTRKSSMTVYRRFLEHGLHCWICTSKLLPDIGNLEILEMSRMLETCLKFLDRVDSIEVIAEDLEIRIHRGKPSEIYIRHNHVSVVMKTIFEARNDFLEDMKAHFAEFMNRVPFRMPASEFCSEYVRDVMKLLHEIGILRCIPSIEKYPELLHYLFPFRIVDLYELGKEDLVVGGVVLDEVVNNEYLEPLFNTKEITDKIRHGGRFIFTGHVSFVEDGDQRGYVVDFM